MTIESTFKTDPAGLAEAARQATGPQYLGDLHVVDQVLRGLSARVLLRFNQVGASTMDRDAAARADKAECADAATIFAGEHQAFTAVENWSPGGLADYLRTRMPGLVDGSDGDVIEQAFATFIHHIYDLVREPGDQNAMAEALAENCRSFAWLLVGMESND